MSVHSTPPRPYSLADLGAIACVWALDPHAPEQVKQAAGEAFVWMLTPLLLQNPLSQEEKPDIALSYIKVALEQMNRIPHLRSLAGISLSLLAPGENHKTLPDSDQRWLDRIRQCTNTGASLLVRINAIDAQPRADWKEFANALLGTFEAMSDDDLISRIADLGGRRSTRLVPERMEVLLDAHRRSLITYLICAEFGLKQSPAFAPIINDVAAIVRVRVSHPMRQRAIMRLVEDASSFIGMLADARQLYMLSSERALGDMPYFMDMLMIQAQGRVSISYETRIALLSGIHGNGGRPLALLGGYADLLAHNRPRTGGDYSPLLRVASMTEPSQLIETIDHLSYPELLHKNVQTLFDLADEKGELKIFLSLTRGCTSEMNEAAFKGLDDRQSAKMASSIRAFIYESEADSHTPTLKGAFNSPETQRAASGQKGRDKGR